MKTRLRKQRMTPKQMASLKKQLLERRSRLIRALQAQLQSVRAGDQFRSSDAGDIAASAMADFESLNVAEMEVRELKKIDGAIQRIDGGTFDVCEECGGPIGQTRLRALPHATLCVSCQEQLEKMGYTPSEEEHWGDVVDSEEDLARSARAPDARLDGVERRY